MARCPRCSRKATRNKNLKILSCQRHGFIRNINTPPASHEYKVQPWQQKLFDWLVKTEGKDRVVVMPRRKLKPLALANYSKEDTE